MNTRIFLVILCLISYTASENCSKSVSNVERIASYFEKNIPAPPDAVLLGYNDQFKSMLLNPTELHYQKLSPVLFGEVSNLHLAIIMGNETGNNEHFTLILGALKLLGAKTYMDFCTAKALNPKYKHGDIMLLKDHIDLGNFIGNSPLTGSNASPLMDNVYDSCLLGEAKKILEDQGLKKSMAEGVYIRYAGPNLPTPAEVNAARILGADSYGPTTLSGITLAKTLEMQVFSLTIIKKSPDDDAKAYKLFCRRIVSVKKMAIKLLGVISNRKCPPSS